MSERPQCTEPRPSGGGSGMHVPSGRGSRMHVPSGGGSGMHVPSGPLRSSKSGEQR
jgi:hypothetical protein